MGMGTMVTELEKRMRGLRGMVGRLLVCDCVELLLLLLLLLLLGLFKPKNR